MKLREKIFVRNLLIYSVMLTAIGFVYNYYAPEAYSSPAIPFINLLFFVFGWITYNYNLKYLEKKAGRFVNFYMLITFFKMMFFVLVILAYLMLRKVDALPFVVAFLIYYLLYTIFEIRAILKISGRNK
ncbi:MAG: hypothetical protein K9G67_08910 [Bacteroidales bacterium]|nr:hypothetical protein [Bacteroidales bacterium]MCF8345095.1 hypothetical protein [Bacteroidales bacterium]MCF8351561.1 hypothetical protein [Bacteroidales bacterium]MCF8376461.1 hypothetical protein [Bacteroidales bacterium]MCF8400580.1 hypothetical protein [Bacteroidales bacterium]